MAGSNEELRARLPNGWTIVTNALGYRIARDAAGNDVIKSFRANDEALFLDSVIAALAPAQEPAGGATPTPQAGVEGVDTDAIESAWIAECGAGWGLGWEEMLRKMFKPGTWGEEYKDGEVIYTHPNHGTELTAYMASKILATHGPFVQGYRAALTAKPATAGQQAAGVSDAVVERAMRAAAAEHERTPSPIPAGYEPIRRQVRAALEAVWPTAAGAAPEGWQPIETAPHTGISVLLWQPWKSGRDCAVIGHYANGWVDRDNEGMQPEPTHWQPMPASPATPNPGAQHGQEGRE